MSDLLGSLFDPGTEFLPRTFIDESQGTGVTGDLFIITPPTGQKVRLTHLSTGVGLEEAGITISFGAVDILTNGIINGSDPKATNAAGKYISIGSYFSFAGATPPAGNFQNVTGGANEALKINKSGGNTANVIYYSYELGE